MKTIWNRGDIFIWLMGVALALSLIVVTGLLAIILFNGLGFFWPKEVALLALKDGSFIQGEIAETEKIPQPDFKDASAKYRFKIKQGNRDVYGNDFLWVDADSVASIQKPESVTVFERREWGNFYGTVKEVKESGKIIAGGPVESWSALQAKLPKVSEILQKIRLIEKDEIGTINYRMEKIRLRLKTLATQGKQNSAEAKTAQNDMKPWQEKYTELEETLIKLRAKLTDHVVVSLPDNSEKEIPLAQIVRVYQPNSFDPLDKAGFFLSKAREFVLEDPRESNTEGGIFPAIFGTVMMVMVMSFFATPLGVLAAFYLREYAKPGPFVSIVRIAVNNLAGVPSIVFGVFGVGFFIYTIGGSIDRFFFSEALPSPTFGTGGILWASLTLALLTVPVVIVATEEGLASVPRGIREASLALGATKAETIWKAVLPAVMPSVLTGLILAMARAAGEVAPLMITGVVKLAPSLPVDSFWPFIHLERKFMHLGFHIYDVGFQSPNVDAARPMVFTTTLLLIGLVILLNFSAIVLRNRMRRRLTSVGL